MANKLFMENKRKLLTSLGGFMGFWIIIGILRGWYGDEPGVSSMTTYIIVSWIMCIFMASKMFSELAKKEKAISLLMTPASSGQKFIIRLLRAVPFVIIIAAAGYIIYYYVNVLSIGIFQDVWLSWHNFFIAGSSNGVILLCLLISFFLFNESLFILGAVLWPKKSFLKTVIAIAALLIIIGFIFWLIAKIFNNLEIYVRIEDETAFTWSVIGILTLLSIGITYIAFLNFKKKTIS